MFCSYCGKQLGSQSIYCPGCGRKTETLDQNTIPVQQPQKVHLEKEQKMVKLPPPTKKKGIGRLILKGIGLPFVIAFFILGLIWTTIIIAITYGGIMSVVTGIQSVLAGLKKTDGRFPVGVGFFGGKVFVVGLDNPVGEGILMIIVGLVMAGIGVYRWEQDIDPLEKEKSISSKIIYSYALLISLACLVGVVYEIIRTL